MGRIQKESSAAPLLPPPTRTGLIRMIPVRVSADQLSFYYFFSYQHCSSIGADRHHHRPSALIATRDSYVNASIQVHVFT